MSDPRHEGGPRAKPSVAWNLDAAHVTVASALLYVIGFVTSNAYFGRYELLRSELLRARYLSAAVLFVFCAAFPVGIGMSIAAFIRARGIAKETPPSPEASRRTRFVDSGWGPLLVVVLLTGAGCLVLL